MKTIRILLTILSITFSTILLAAPVNINTADAASIASNIKGIGSKKAEAIIAYRESNGSFNTPEEIMHVKGIGQKTFEKIKDSFYLEDENNSEK